MILIYEYSLCEFTQHCFGFDMLNSKKCSFPLSLSRFFLLCVRVCVCVRAREQPLNMTIDVTLSHLLLYPWLTETATSRLFVFGSLCQEMKNKSHVLHSKSSPELCLDINANNVRK